MQAMHVAQTWCNHSVLDFLEPLDMHERAQRGILRLTKVLQVITNNDDMPCYNNNSLGKMDIL